MGISVNWLEAVWLVVNSLGLSLALREVIVNWRRLRVVQDALKLSNGRLRMARDNLATAYILLTPLVLFMWIGLIAALRPGPPEFSAVVIALLVASGMCNLGAGYVWARRRWEQR